jgi:F-type H+-transporting ATPase subunit b
MSAPESQPQPENAVPVPAADGRKRFLAYYLIGYAFLAAVYVYFLLTVPTELTPQAYLEQGFSQTTDRGAEALEDALLEPAHIRLWEPIAFTTPDGRRYSIPARATLNADEAAALAKTLLAEKNKPAKEREVGTLVVFEESALGHVPWPYVLTVYNILGLFLLLYVFVWGPMQGLLDGKIRETNEELAAARKAREEAQRLKKRYENILAEIEAEKARLEETGRREFEEEHERILATARHEADLLLETMRQSLSAEVAVATGRLREEIASAAVARARETLAAKASRDDHARAVEDFLAALDEVKLT